GGSGQQNLRGRIEGGSSLVGAGDAHDRHFTAHPSERSERRADRFYGGGMHDRLTRRFLMLLAAYGMAVSVAACGSGSDESADTSAPPAETTAVPLASTSLEFRPVLSSGPCEDGGEDGTSPGEDVLRASG